MEFALVGPHQGKDITLGGFRFRRGVADIPEDAKDAHNLLRNFYSAHPAHLIVRGEDGKLFLQEGTPEAPSVGNVAILPPPPPVTEKPLEDLNSFSMPELTDVAQQMGLPATGPKAALIARITEAKLKAQK